MSTQIFQSIMNFFTSQIILDGIFIGAIAYVGVLWVALVSWVVRDVNARSRNIGFKTLSILLTAGLNIFGVLIYLLMRPKKTINERLFEKLELQTFMEELQKSREPAKAGIKPQIITPTPMANTMPIKKAPTTFHSTTNNTKKSKSTSKS